MLMYADDLVIMGDTLGLLVNMEKNKGNGIQKWWNNKTK